MGEFGGATTATVERVPPGASIRAEPAVGFASAELTPPAGVAMAGYSTDGHRGREGGRLRARAMYARDARGRSAAVVVLDLMSGSRYLWERVASRVAARTGITRERLVVAGTHTHSAPGHFYGCSLYDHLAQCRSGFDERLANEFAEVAAGAVHAAFETARPGRIGLAEVPLWGLTRNASVDAFDRNPEADGWPCPERRWSPAQRAIDPRLTVLVAVDGGRIFGSLAVFAGHNTALGPAQRSYDADWIGVACELASEELHEAMLSPGAGGDLNTLRDDLRAGPVLADHVGRAVGAAWVETARRAAALAAPFEVDMHFGVLDRTQPRVEDRADTELDETFVFGVPALGGGEEGRTVFHRLGLARPGRTSRRFDVSHPQHPKAVALGPLQGLYRRWRRLELSPELPLHVLRLGGLTLATVPGEPTVMVGHRIEAALAAPGQRVRVLGYAGDYAGYVTTAEEYEHQGYEGASTLLGRHVARHLEARLRQIADTPAGAPAAGRALFATPSTIHR